MHILRVALRVCPCSSNVMTITVLDYLAINIHCQVFIIFNGGTGTISEFGMAWGLARLHFGHHKPLVLYGDFWQEIIFAFTRGMYIRSEERLVFKIVNNPQDTLSAIIEFEKQMPTFAFSV